MARCWGLESGKRRLEARVRKSRTLFRDQIRGGGDLRLEDTLDKGGVKGRFDPREVRAANCLLRGIRKAERPTSLSWAPNTSPICFLVLISTYHAVDTEVLQTQADRSTPASKYSPSPPSPEPLSLPPLSNFSCSSQGASISLT